MKLLIGFIILSICELCYVNGQESIDPSLNEYLLPNDEETKSLHVKFTNEWYDSITAYTATCYNYNSLKYLELKKHPLQQYRGVRIVFENCFNNETNNENFNFSVANVVNKLIQNVTDNSYKLHLFHIQLSALSIVNCDVLFHDFNYTQFHHSSFSDIACTSPKFLNHVKCKFCSYTNNIEIDFNAFHDNINETTTLYILSNKLLNFNQNNLKKFSVLNKLQIESFSLNDYDTFNVPAIFAHNSQLTHLIIKDSDRKITFHDDVFQGLTNLSDLTLQGLQLEYISEKLFTYLVILESAHLESNNIKTLHPNTFANNRMLYDIFLNGNPIFMEPQNDIQPITFISEIGTSLRLENFTIHTIDVFEHLVNNPNLTSVLFKSLVMDPINITDFIRIHSNRNKTLYVEFDDLNVTASINFDYIKSNSIPLKYFTRIPANMIIVMPFHDRYCEGYLQSKEIVYGELSNKPNDILFHFVTPRVHIQPVISCQNKTD